MSEYSERLVRVETEVVALKEAFEEHKEQTRQEFASVNKKLDDLLALRNKGAGVLWFLGAAGVIIVELIHYFWSGR